MSNPHRESMKKYQRGIRKAWRRKAAGHKHAEKMHARWRFATRVGIQLNKEIEQAIIRQIKDGVARLVQKQSNKRQVYSVLIDDKRYHIVYDRYDDCIVTVFEPLEE